MYSYFFVLSLLGLAEIVEWQKVKSYKTWLKDFKKGKVVLFKGKFIFDVIIDKKLFKQILDLPNENYSKEIIQHIIKLSPEVK